MTIDGDMPISPSTRLSMKVRLVGLLIIVVMSTILWANNALYFWPALVDDSFITFRHSLNAAEGIGLQYNPVERSEAHSAPIWTTLHILPFVFGWDVILFSKLLGLVFCASAILMTVLYGRRLGLQCSSFAALLLCAWTPIGYWAVQGMETPLALAISIGVVLVHHIEVSAGRRIWWTAVMLAIGAQSRPEGVLFVAPVAVQHVVLLWPDWRRGLRLALWPAVLCIVLCAIALGLRYAYYGSVFANPSLVKMFVKMFPEKEALGYVRCFLLGRPVVLTLLTASCALLAWRARRLLAVPVASLAAWSAFAYVAHGDWMPNFRLLVPCMPFVAILAVCALHQGLNLPRVGVRSAVTMVLLGCLAVFCVSEGSYMTIRAHADYSKVTPRSPYWALLQPSRFVRGGWSMPASRLALTTLESVPPGGTVSCYDIGMLGFVRPDVTVMDVVGLGDRRIAEMLVRGTVEEEFLAYFLERRPEVAFVYKSASGGGYDDTARLLLGSKDFRNGWTRRDSFKNWAGMAEVYVRKDLPTEQPADQWVRASERMVGLLPRTPYAWVEYGEALAAAGDVDGAYEVWEQVQRRFPANAWANYATGHHFRNSNKLELSYQGFANGWYHSCLMRGGRYLYVPSSYQPFVDLLVSLLLLDRGEEALTEGQRFLQVVPGYKPVQYYAAMAALRMGRDEQGRQLLRSVAEGSDADAQSLQYAALASDSLGNVALKDGDLEAARRWFERAQSLFHNPADKKRVRSRLQRLDSSR